MFKTGKEYVWCRDFNLFFRLYFFIFGAPEIGAKIRSKLALQEIRRQKFETFLDAGCGKGYVAFRAAVENPNASIQGVDFDDDKIRKNSLLKDRFNLSNLSYQKADLLDFNPGCKYDLILASDVLEHIQEDEQVLCNFRSWLKPGGKLILHVPRSKEYHFFKKASQYVVEDHVRPGYTEEELAKKLGKAGFCLKQTIGSYNYFETLANQVGNIFSNKLLIYSLLLPLLTVLSYLPQHRLPSPRHISNTIITIAETKS